MEAEAQHGCHTAAGSGRLSAAPWSTEGKTAASAASSPDIASGITDLSFFILPMVFLAVC